MGFIFKGILVVIWLLVVPCLAGGFYFRREKRTCGEYLLAGYTLLFAITELLSLTMIFTKQPLHVLTVTYGVVAGVLAFLGARSLYKKRQKNRISPELVVAGILILIQLIVVVLYAHMDEDDAFYVGTATTAVETDSLYAYNPYTGAAYNVLPSRYILSPFPAFLARLHGYSGFSCIKISIQSRNKNGKNTPASTAFPCQILPIVKISELYTEYPQNHRITAQRIIKIPCSPAFPRKNMRLY